MLKIKITQTIAFFVFKHQAKPDTSVTSKLDIK